MAINKLNNTGNCSLLSRNIWLNQNLNITRVPLIHFCHIETEHNKGISYISKGISRINFLCFPTIWSFNFFLYWKLSLDTLRTLKFGKIKNSCTFNFQKDSKLIDDPKKFILFSIKAIRFGIASDCTTLFLFCFYRHMYDWIKCRSSSV